MSVAVAEGEEELVRGLYINVVLNGPCKLILMGLQEIGKPKPFNLIDFCGTIMCVKCLFKGGRLEITACREAQQWPYMEKLSHSMFWLEY